MAIASLPAIVRYCDRILHTARFSDYDGAMNGLQVEKHGPVKRIAAAVDASLATIQMAIEANADLLLAHHGLFWSRRQPWTGPNYELLRLLIETNVAVYSSHLPLDAHPRVGNNVRLCAALGFKRPKPFFLVKGQPIGLKISTRIALNQLVRRLAAVTNATPKIVPGGPRVCERIGIVTGGAGGELKQAVDENVDTFITGEGPHWTYALAEELGVNVLYAGHYATETFGVKALAAELSAQFRLPWLFLDHPTGL